MGNKYKLVNPYIKGEFETKLKAKNSIEAAKSFYNNLSEHFNNNVINAKIGKDEIRLDPNK